MPPKKDQAAKTAASDGVPGKPAHPEYVIGHADGLEIGRQEGYAKGLEAGGASGDAIAGAERRGYDRGYQAAQDERRPPLFEAAKKVCENNFSASDNAIWAEISAVEHDRAETLSGPDRALLEGVVRRHRLAAEAQKQALVQAAAKPKSDVGRRAARSLQEGETEERAETVYDLVK